MAKALVVYNTRKGSTRKIAELIAEGLRISGVETEVVDVVNIKKPDNLKGYDAYIFGSPTYHGDMLEKTKQLLFMAEQAGLEGKVGGAFGAYGWSGEAPERIFGTMENIFKMDMLSGPLMLKSASLQGGVQMAQEYGRQAAKKLPG